MEKPKILVVDDEPDFRSAIQMRLETAGYEVITAPDGQQAFSKVMDQHPDLILLDIHMPNEDGHFVLQRLRERTDEISKLQYFF